MKMCMKMSEVKDLGYNVSVLLCRKDTSLSAIWYALMKRFSKATFLDPQMPLRVPCHDPHVRPTSVLYGADWGPSDQILASDKEFQQNMEEDFDVLNAAKSTDSAKSHLEAATVVRWSAIWRTGAHEFHTLYAPTIGTVSRQNSTPNDGRS
ncbi:hypothetical protein CY35_04G119400 [Sphagnum magellanicum]|nr:hypothetical protein CY35_04G119400 [Sphagnum magellanicum]